MIRRDAGARQARSLTLLPALALLAALPGCAALSRAPAVSARTQAPPVWPFETSDLPVEPGYRFGRLDNGMRYVVRANRTPAGTALVRFVIDAGSLDESGGERGFAHFVEHMAFEGSTRVPEGEMVRLLERKGLGFGADTNASTGYERTTYKLDLPNTRGDMIDTALMLMRETASELLIAPGAVKRQQGVILSEMRDRNTWSLRDYVAEAGFFYPEARYAQRLPIGTAEALAGATAESLRAFYKREYVPAHATLVVIGDVDAAAVEAQIRARFADWQGPAPDPQPSPGPVRAQDRDRTAIRLDPALSERVTVLRSMRWREEPDTIAQRQENLLARIGYGVINRRLAAMARSADPPFRGAGFGTGDVLRAARSTRLIVDSADGKWRRGLVAAVQTWRSAMARGFSEAEIAEQVANLRSGLVNAAASASTRSHAALTDAVLDMLADGTVPTDPAGALQRFEALAPRITPASVMAALRRDMVPLRKPLIRFAGRKAPEGGDKALRAAWAEGLDAASRTEAPRETGAFAYTDFGPAGRVIADSREAETGIRSVRFANGVMLNLKRTQLEAGRVRVSLAIDGGDRLATRERPLTTELVPWLDDGGLGKHSADALQTILAGRSLSASLESAPTAFTASAATVPQDLEVQLQLLAALVTDPGYRPEGEVRYRQQVNTFFAQLRETPASALSAEIGGIVSGNDPRFTLQPADAYRALSYAAVRPLLGERLAKGAIEIGLVGDMDEEAAIALVARTFGALPAREAAFHTLDAEPARPFTANRSLRIVRHAGPADQAIVRLVWPTRDDADPVETLRLALVERVLRIRLTEGLREALGKAYSPSAISAPSREWMGFGTFSLSASVDVKEVAAARRAMIATVAALREQPLSADELERARAPLTEAFANALKGNGGWMSLTARAQSEPDRIARFQAAPARLAAITPAEIEATARLWLDPAKVLPILVLPEGAPLPAE